METSRTYELIEEKLINILRLTWSEHTIDVAVNTTETLMNHVISNSVIFEMRNSRVSLFSMLVEDLKKFSDGQERLIAFLKLLPSSISLASVITCHTVQSVCKNKWLLLYTCLQEIMLAEIGSIVRKTIHRGGDHNFMSLVDTAREAIFKVFNLDLSSITEVLERCVKEASKSCTAHAIRTVCLLFSQPYLFEGSYFETLMKRTISNCSPSKHKHLALMDALRMEDDRHILHYANVSMSPQEGSFWLRELVLLGNNALSEEEKSRHMDAENALISRWFKFTRLKKTRTKRAVILEVVDGTNLIDFAFCMVSPLARTLLDFLAYMVFVETPDVVDANMCSYFIKTAEEKNFYCLHDSGVRMLSLRLSASLETCSSVDSFACAAELSVQRGLPPISVLPLVVSTSLRSSNVVLWRKVLRHCLKTYTCCHDLILRLFFVDQ